MARPFPSVDLNWLHEDKIILDARRALALIWTDVMTPTQQAAWMTRWLTYSPTDITGHVYTPYTATKFSETKVQPETAYAWSQIYGYYRFKRPAVLSPIGTIYPAVSLSNLFLSQYVFTIDYDGTTTALPSLDMLIFASGPAPKGAVKNVNTVRPMCAMPAESPTGTLDFWRCWHHRYGEQTPLAITATAGHVNVNNELIRSLDVLTALVSP